MGRFQDLLLESSLTHQDSFLESKNIHCEDIGLGAAAVTAGCLTFLLIVVWIFVTWFARRASGTPGNATPVQV